MALTTVEVTGNLYLQDGSGISGASVTFDLSNPSSDVVDPGVIPPTTVSVDTDGSGAFSVDLWPNDRGAAISYYSVSVTYVDEITGKRKKDRLGKIQVPEAGAPHTLASLLAAGQPSFDAVYVGIITEAQYQAAIDAVAQAESAAAIAQSGTDINVESFSELESRLVYSGATGSELNVPSGTYVRNRSTGYVYLTLDSGELTFDLDYTGSGGVKLKVLASRGYVSVEQCGFSGLGLDDSTPFEIATTAANRENVGVHIPSWATVNLPAGTYTMPNKGFHGGGKIKGADFTYGYASGAPTTRLEVSGAYGTPISVTAAVAQGNTSIVTDSDTGWSAGDVFLIRDDTGTTTDNRMELCVVRSVSGTTVNVTTPLKYDYGSTRTVTLMTPVENWKDGGCTFEDIFLYIRRANGVDYRGSYYGCRVYNTEVINIFAALTVFDGRDSECWFGVSNLCRLGSITGTFQNVDSTDTQGYVKLNCGIHDFSIDITAVGSPGTVDPQNGVHIDTYFLNNTQIDADFLPCSNIRATCNGVGLNRSVFAVSNPSLSAGSPNRSWNITMEGSGATVLAQGIEKSRIEALTRDTEVSLYGVQSCDVYCFDRPFIASYGGFNLDDCRVYFTYAPTITVVGDSVEGTCTYVNRRALTEYRDGWGHLYCSVEWSGHTGTGNLTVQVLDATAINNANNCVATLSGTDVGSDTERYMIFTSTTNPSSTTPTNSFKVRETSTSGGGVLDIAPSGFIAFEAHWAIGLFGTA